MKNATARQIRKLNFISNFFTNVHCFEGTNNVVANCLSRSTDINVLFEELRPLDFGTMRDEQAVDSKICNLVKTDTHFLQLSYVQISRTNKRLLDKVSQKQFRPVVPRAFRKQVFDTLYALSHPGIKASQKLISQRFVYPCMRSNLYRTSTN